MTLQNKDVIKFPTRRNDNMKFIAAGNLAVWHKTRTFNTCVRIYCVLCVYLNLKYQNDDEEQFYCYSPIFYFWKTMIIWSGGEYIVCSVVVYMEL